MEKKFKNVCVIGLGYVGLPTAALLASRSFSVTGVDVNSDVVDIINRGEVHIIEPDLDIVVRSAVLSKKLRAASKPESADVFIISVPTPLREGNKPDVSAVQSAAKSIASVLEKGNLVILESTSPIGTTQLVSESLAENRSDLCFPHTDGDDADVQIAYCPERILPGQVLQELVENDRIVGGLSGRCTERAISFYQLFVKGDCLGTNAQTSEMAKLTENSFRDVNIAFANEISMLCDKFEIDVWKLIDLVNRHPRVNVLTPGPGVGGHCIAVDPWFIVDSAPKESRLIRTGREVNLIKTEFVIDKIRRETERFTNPVIACLGLSYKPDIDDLRESPSVEIVRRLAEMKLGTILVVEPFIEHLPDSLNDPPIVLMELDQALQKADIVVVLTGHETFKSVKTETLKEKSVIDTRGVWR